MRGAVPSIGDWFRLPRSRRESHGGLHLVRLRAPRVEVGGHRQIHDLSSHPGERVNRRTEGEKSESKIEPRTV